MNIVRSTKYRFMLRLIAFTVITVMVCQSAAWAGSGCDKVSAYKLAPKSLFAGRDIKDEPGRKEVPIEDALRELELSIYSADGKKVSRFIFVGFGGMPEPPGIGYIQENVLPLLREEVKKGHPYEVVADRMPDGRLRFKKMTTLYSVRPDDKKDKGKKPLQITAKIIEAFRELPYPTLREVVVYVEDELEVSVGEDAVVTRIRILNMGRKRARQPELVLLTEEEAERRRREDREEGESEDENGSEGDGDEGDGDGGGKRIRTYGSTFSGIPKEEALEILNRVEINWNLKKFHDCVAKRVDRAKIHYVELIRKCNIVDAFQSKYNEICQEKLGILWRVADRLGIDTELLREIKNGLGVTDPEIPKITRGCILLVIERTKEEMKKIVEEEVKWKLNNLLERVGMTVNAKDLLIGLDLEEEFRQKYREMYRLKQGRPDKLSDYFGRHIGKLNRLVSDLNIDVSDIELFEKGSLLEGYELEKNKILAELESGEINWNLSLFRESLIKKDIISPKISFYKILKGLDIIADFLKKFNERFAANQGNYGKTAGDFGITHPTLNELLELTGAEDLDLTSFVSYGRGELLKITGLKRDEDDDKDELIALVRENEWKLPKIIEVFKQRGWIKKQVRLYDFIIGLDFEVKFEDEARRVYKINNKNKGLTAIYFGLNEAILRVVLEKLGIDLDMPRPEEQKKFIDIVYSYAQELRKETPLGEIHKKMKDKIGGFTGWEAEPDTDEIKVKFMGNNTLCIGSLEKKKYRIVFEWHRTIGLVLVLKEPGKDKKEDLIYDLSDCKNYDERGIHGKMRAYKKGNRGDVKKFEFNLIMEEYSKLYKEGKTLPKIHEALSDDIEAFGDWEMEEPKNDCFAVTPVAGSYINIVFDHLPASKLFLKLQWDNIMGLVVFIGSQKDGVSRSEEDLLYDIRPYVEYNTQGSKEDPKNIIAPKLGKRDELNRARLNTVIKKYADLLRDGKPLEKIKEEMQEDMNLLGGWRRDVKSSFTTTPVRNNVLVCQRTPEGICDISLEWMDSVGMLMVFKPEEGEGAKGKDVLFDIYSYKDYVESDEEDKPNIPASRLGERDSLPKNDTALLALIDKLRKRIQEIKDRKPALILLEDLVRKYTELLQKKTPPDEIKELFSEDIENYGIQELTLDANSISITPFKHNTMNFLWLSPGTYYISVFWHDEWGLSVMLEPKDEENEIMKTQVYDLSSCVRFDIGGKERNQLAASIKTKEYFTIEVLKQRLREKGYIEKEGEDEEIIRPTDKLIKAWQEAWEEGYTNVTVKGCMIMLEEEAEGGDWQIVRLFSPATGEEENYVSGECSSKVKTRYGESTERKASLYGILERHTNLLKRGKTMKQIKDILLSDIEGYGMWHLQSIKSDRYEITPVPGSYYRFCFTKIMIGEKYIKLKWDDILGLLVIFSNKEEESEEDLYYKASSYAKATKYAGKIGKREEIDRARFNEIVMTYINLLENNIPLESIKEDMKEVISLYGKWRKEITDRLTTSPDLRGKLIFYNIPEGINEIGFEWLDDIGLMVVFRKEGEDRENDLFYDPSPYAHYSGGGQCSAKKIGTRKWIESASLDEIREVADTKLLLGEERVALDDLGKVILKYADYLKEDKELDEISGLMASSIEEYGKREIEFRAKSFTTSPVTNNSLMFIDVVPGKYHISTFWHKDYGLLVRIDPQDKENESVRLRIYNVKPYMNYDPETKEKKQIIAGNITSRLQVSIFITKNDALDFLKSRDVNWDLSKFQDHIKGLIGRTILLKEILEELKLAGDLQEKYNEIYIEKRGKYKEIAKRFGVSVEILRRLRSHFNITDPELPEEDSSSSKPVTDFISKQQALDLLDNDEINWDLEKLRDHITEIAGRVFPLDRIFKELELAGDFQKKYDEVYTECRGKHEDMADKFGISDGMLRKLKKELNIVDPDVDFEPQEEDTEEEGLVISIERQEAIDFLEDGETNWDLQKFHEHVLRFVDRELDLFVLFSKLDIIDEFQKKYDEVYIENYGVYENIAKRFGISKDDLRDLRRYLGIIDPDVSVVRRGLRKSIFGLMSKEDAVKALDILQWNLEDFRDYIAKIVGGAVDYIELFRDLEIADKLQKKYKEVYFEEYGDYREIALRFGVPTNTLRDIRERLRLEDHKQKFAPIIPRITDKFDIWMNKRQVFRMFERRGKRWDLQALQDCVSDSAGACIHLAKIIPRLDLVSESRKEYEGVFIEKEGVYSEIAEHFNISEKTLATLRKSLKLIEPKLPGMEPRSDAKTIKKGTPAKYRKGEEDEEQDCVFWRDIVLSPDGKIYLKFGDESIKDFVVKDVLEVLQIYDSVAGKWIFLKDLVTIPVKDTVGPELKTRKKAGDEFATLERGLPVRDPSGNKYTLIGPRHKDREREEEVPIDPDGFLVLKPDDEGRPVKIAVKKLAEEGWEVLYGSWTRISDYIETVDAGAAPESLPAGVDAGQGELLEAV